MRLIDGVLWVGLAGAVLAETWGHPGQAAAGVAVVTVVVAAARFRPAVALAAGASANLVYLAELPESEVWPTLVSAVAGFLAGRRLRDTVTAAAVFAAAGAAGLVVAVVTGDAWEWVGMVTPMLGFGVLPWFAGRYSRLRSMVAVAGWRRAEQLERERELVALRERHRIAGDMHDSLGHELALIAMRAGALELDAALGEPQRRAAGEVRAAAVDASERLHDILGLLRQDGIPALVERSRAAGADIAYRVVQEAVTNAVKHAPGASITVTVHNGPGDAPAARPPGGGRGLAGLRERVTRAGGTLRAGPAAGGYEVTADIPVRPPAAATGDEASVRTDVRRRLAAAVAVPVSIGITDSSSSIMRPTLRRRPGGGQWTIDVRRP